MKILTFEARFTSGILLLMCNLVILTSLNSQDKSQWPVLQSQFTDYQILQIETEDVYRQIYENRSGGALSLRLNDSITWNLDLEHSGIISDKYQVISATENGQTKHRGTHALPMQGKVQNVSNSRVSLTFNHGFIYGFVRLGQQTFFIEPLKHFEKQAASDMFVLYNTNDIKPGPDMTCGVKTTEKEESRLKQGLESRSTGQCKVIEYALASDFQMFTAYGGNSGVENHNIGVLNNVQTNFDDEFADELQYEIVEQWISNCSSCDPWTSSTNAEILLQAFSEWGPSGFSNTHDNASLWTKRDFDGSTIGIAWLGTVCYSLRYNCLQDFTSNAAFKRVLMAHEIGHNFDATHNTGIMAPAVSGATNWSLTSVTEIEAYYNSISCLAPCNNQPPNSDFSYEVLDNCEPAQVQFTDESFAATSWAWSFPGGIPSTSTQSSPLVTYNTAGQYEVTLTVTNAFGSNSSTQIISVDAEPQPVADFDYSVNLNQVFFEYTGTGGTSFQWNFGDNSPVSNGQNPIHTYTSNGSYVVTLTVSNNCGFDQKSYTVVISFPPTANFTANITTGCAPLLTTFTNQSSNATSYLWDFSGPVTFSSNLTSPTINFTTPGIYTVSLTAFNSAGSVTQVKTNYINVKAKPVAGYNYNLSGPQATFTNTGSSGTTFTWDFGDGATSNAQNPVHNYLANGTFSVIQTLTNECGTSSTTQQVTIAVPPVSSFTPSADTQICAGQSVTFNSTSTYGPTSLQWIFPGGNPSVSTLTNPVVQYSTTGDYDVTLIATNAFGSDTLTLVNHIEVEDRPEVAFTYNADELTVQFTSQITDGSSPEWNFGDGQSFSGANPIHTFSQEGVYEVVFSAANQCGISADTQYVEVQFLPVAGFLVDSNIVCINTPVQYTSNSSPTVQSWLWSFEGGSPATSTDANPVVTYSQPGSYGVNLIVTNLAGSDTIQETALISAFTLPQLEFVGDIEGNQILLSSNEPFTALEWNVFNDFTDVSETGSPYTFTASQNGTYFVRLLGENICGEAISDTVAYEISAYPVASYNVNNGSAVCAGTTAVFTANQGSNTSFEWKFSGGSPATASGPVQEVVYSAPGIYDVTLIVSNTLGSDTLETEVQVLQLPEADFDFEINSPEVNFSFTGSAANALTWQFGDGNSGSGPEVSHSYAVSGTYNVVLIVQNECGLDSISSPVSVIGSSTSEFALFSQVKITPNPSEGQFNLFLTSSFAGDCRIQIADMTGRRLLDRSERISEGFQMIPIDASLLSDGMYMIIISENKRSTSLKFIISH
jgi:PKD repeat protein